MNKQLKQIVVEVTPAQEELINAVAKELGCVRPGDLLLAEAFISLSMNYAPGSNGLSEGICGSICGLSKFVAHRHLPAMCRVSQINNYTIDSRPADGGAVPETPPASPDGTQVTIPVRVSESLAQLVTGYATVHGQGREEYIIDSLLSSVKCDSESSLHEWTPEFKASAR